MGSILCLYIGAIRTVKFIDIELKIMIRKLQNFTLLFNKIKK